MINNDAALNKI